ncbi:metallophosphoesterase family protein [Sphingomonas sp.]|jgi:serine/threonine protein phosphatase 1|uniref:metallophosphoesterase family protein n=1 Tax=Sphingomonas sp. TaxID=28214 RepID=UPI002ED99440
MLRKLLNIRAAPSSDPASIPEGQRVYAIGDVHGCLHLLDELLSAIDADDARRSPAQTAIVLLGDLVDRGPDSAGVVERVIRLRKERPDVRFLLGNHEEVFLAALDGDLQALRMFCRIGGRETALSYGITAAAYESMDYPELAAALAAAVPPEHRMFLEQGTEMEVIGDYAFVHAGIRPGVPLDQQRGSDLRWIRETFLDHRDVLEKMVVHGHSISDAVAFMPHRIGIDTGAYLTGRLTALGLQGSETWHLDTA